MRRIERIFALLVLIAVVVAGCTPAAQKSRAGRASESQPYDFRAEGKIPPDDGSAREEADVVETPVTEDAIEVQEAEAPRDTTPPAPTPQAVLIDGFRVQVFASASPQVAEGARRTAQARTGKSAYVEFVDGLYKVRVGNCRTREQAEKLLAELKSGHYRDAWIVETRIEVPEGTEGSSD